MWSNLAGRLKEQIDGADLRDTITRIGDVVAPPLASDEEYETDEEEYEYYEEEEVVANAGLEEENDHQNSKESLGTRLQHLLDDEEEAHHRLELREQEGKLFKTTARPMIPDDDEEDDDIDDDQEEEISFLSQQQSQGRTQKPDTLLASDRVSIPTKVESTTKTSATNGPSRHFPGAPVPHEHRNAREQKERILPYAKNESLDETCATDEPPPNLTAAVSDSNGGRESQWSVKASSPVPPPKPAHSRNVTTSTATSAALATAVDEQPHSTGPSARPAPVRTRNSSGETSPLPRTKAKAPSLDTRTQQQPPPPPPPPGQIRNRGKNESNDLTRTSLPKPASSALQPPTLPPATQPAAAPKTSNSRNKEAETRVPPSSLIKNRKQEPPSTDAADNVPPPPQHSMRERLPIESSSDTTNSSKSGPLSVAPTSTPSTESETISASARAAESPPSPPSKQTPAPPTPSLGTATTSKGNASKTPAPPPPRPSTRIPQEQHGASAKESSSDGAMDNQMKRRCQELETQLQHAEKHIVELQRDAAQRMDEEEEWRLSHLKKFQQEQARMVEAATEAVADEHKRELAEMRDLLQQECLTLKQELQEERTESQRQAQQFQLVLEEAEARAETAETAKRKVETRQKSSMSQLQQQQERAVRMAEDKLAHTLAKLDDREEEVAKLKKEMKELKAASSEHREVAQEAEEEMDELHAENETLQQTLHVVQSERDELNKQLKLFESQKEKMSGLQMELRMLKEARDRERAHRENAAVDAESSQAELVTERDAALSTARDLEHQLTATLADLDIARSDADRITMANVNLQSALEAFQNERDAEMNLMEQQRADAEQATAAAHAVAIEATHEANEARMRELQFAADAAVKNVMAEVQELQLKLEHSRKENVNLRRSLDEAIHRLQTTQEDVIDRVFMKNILLDWFAKSGKGKRDVLALMASVLHFTEEEKDSIHIGEHSGALGKVVGAVAAPLPPSAADIEHLEGDSVREKWVNFLMAETAGDETGPKEPEPSSATTNGNAI